MSASGPNISVADENGVDWRGPSCSFWSEAELKDEPEAAPGYLLLSKDSAGTLGSRTDSLGRPIEDESNRTWTVGFGGGIGPGNIWNSLGTPTSDLECE